jgi:SAM-dependent methyltransferase
MSSQARRAPAGSQTAEPAATARPVFVVGSPRSGTSVFTWALGQHPNLFPIEESNWISKFATDLWSTYELGAGRGMRSHLGSMGVERDELYAACGELIDRLTRGYRPTFEQLGYLHSLDHPDEINEAFQISRAPEEPKSRWVDGTPEYSLSIVGLRKLFPNAQFIHLVRDVRSVVKSLVNFVGDDGIPFVANEQEAYEYWLRTVRACHEAELAYGSKVVLRVRHRDLVDSPEAVVRSCLSFLDERFSDLCIEPLQTKINSSNVPADFEFDDSDVNPATVEQAEALSREVIDGPYRRLRPNNARIAALEQQFVDIAEWTGLLWEEGSDPRRLFDAYNREREAVIGLRDALERERQEALKIRESIDGRERDFRRVRAEAALHESKAASAEEEAALLRETVEATREEADWLRDSLAAVMEAALKGGDRCAALAHAHELAHSTIPLGASVLVVSKGDDDLLRMVSRQASHFPQSEDGTYSGHHPETSAEAIAHLEDLRASGAEYLFFPATSLWWLDHYSELRAHLESDYAELVRDESVGAVFALGDHMPAEPSTALSNPIRQREFSFRCNICGATSLATLNELERERPSCDDCGSTVRFRGVMHVLSEELFGESLPLSEFPVRSDIVGIGLTDWGAYADRLAEKFAYQNTFLHQEPTLDITQDDPSRHGTVDFVICSDVLEHVAPPVDRALQNLRKLLKPEGVLVLTVPYGKHAETVEHFPELYEYELIERDGEQIVRNRTREGVIQEFQEIVFHEGPGTTLEMRMFGEQDLLKRLAQAGFERIAIHSDDCLDFGIHWQVDWSLPVTARR